MEFKRLNFYAMAKLRWTKNPCGTWVLETQVPIDHLLPSFFFFFSFFFLSPDAIPRQFFFFKQFFLLLLLPQTSKPISQNLKPKNHDIKIKAKTQSQKSQSQHQSALGLMISKPERLGLLISAPKVRFLVWFVSWFVFCVF